MGVGLGKTSDPQGKSDARATAHASIFQLR